MVCCIQLSFVKNFYIRNNVSRRFNSSSGVIGAAACPGCCFRRFNNSSKCSSSKIYSLSLLLIGDVFDERRVRFDEEDGRVSLLDCGTDDDSSD